MTGQFGWSVRRSDTHHYLAGIVIGDPITTQWSRSQQHALPFAHYEEARKWVEYFGNTRPCYVHERRG